MKKINPIITLVLLGIVLTIPTIVGFISSIFFNIIGYVALFSTIFVYFLVFVLYLILSEAWNKKFKYDYRNYNADKKSQDKLKFKLSELQKESDRLKEEIELYKTGKKHKIDDENWDEF